MYIESFIPTAENHTIEIPKEFYGQVVKIEITPNVSVEIKEDIVRGKNIKQAFEYWDKNGRDLSSFTFNRDEANER